MTSWMPHGHCVYWNEPLIITWVAADLAIALAYYTIPCILASYRRWIPGWPWLVAFILLCGTGHLFKIWNIWNANYWPQVLCDALTGIVSMASAVALLILLARNEVDLTKILEDREH